jgi:hypothetical protein
VGQLQQAAFKLSRQLVMLDAHLAGASSRSYPAQHKRARGFRDTSGTDVDLFGSAATLGRAHKRHSVLLIRTSDPLFKGHPEYDPDQQRGEDGRWSASGAWRESGTLNLGTIKNPVVRAAVAVVVGLGLIHTPLAIRAVQNVVLGKPWHVGVAVPKETMRTYQQTFDELKRRGYRFEIKEDGTYRVLPPEVGKGVPARRKSQ